MSSGSLGFRYQVTKTYPQRGSLSQYRLAQSLSFACFRCGRDKTSKLVAVLDNNAARLLCNGCYGFLVSIYEIKAGEGSTTDKADRLTDQLVQLVSADERRQVEAALLKKEDQAANLDPSSLRMLATSEFVADGLAGKTEFDWSAAVIGLCKAVELEMVVRLVEPLRAACQGLDLRPEVSDKDLGRMAGYCAGKTKPPELGAVRHTLQTLANSKHRVATSALAEGLRSLMATWPRSDWLLRPDGALKHLQDLTTYRNSAAHIDELDDHDYRKCRELVVGNPGFLWHFVLATTSRR